MLIAWSRKLAKCGDGNFSILDRIKWCAQACAQTDRRLSKN